MKLPATLILLATLSIAQAETPMEELPMYGGQHEPTVEKSVPNSQDAARLGWRYYYQGDLSTAMKRFNQAWMFDRDNAEAFWGFGLIMGRRAAQGETEQNLQASIRLLEKARDLTPSNGRILGDLAFSHTILGHWSSTQGQDATKQYATAEALFQQAGKLDSKYPPIPANWSVLKFYQDDYPAAQRLLDRATALGFTPDPEYAKALAAKLKQSPANGSVK